MLWPRDGTLLVPPSSDTSSAVYPLHTEMRSCRIFMSFHRTVTVGPAYRRKPKGVFLLFHIKQACYVCLANKTENKGEVRPSEQQESRSGEQTQTVACFLCSLCSWWEMCFALERHCSVINLKGCERIIELGADNSLYRHLYILADKNLATHICILRQRSRCWTRRCVCKVS